MFEIGKYYRLTFSEELGSHEYVYGETLAFEGTLLKVRVQGEEKIFNTAAYVFLSAVEWQMPDGSLVVPQGSTILPQI